MEEEYRIVRVPKGLASKINEVAVKKYQDYNTVSEFVIESARRHLEVLNKQLMSSSTKSV